jgi:hypothetical protein
LIAQAKHLLSGLTSIVSFLHPSYPAEIKLCKDLLYLEEHLYKTAITYTSADDEKMDCLLSKNSVQLVVDQQRVARNEPIVVDIDQICHLRSIGFTWMSISQLLDISLSTLYRRQMEENLTNDLRLSDITNDELVMKIQEIWQSMPNCGERMLNGSLRSSGVIVQRWRLRQAIHSIDPVSSGLRWYSRIQRKPYLVPGPMSLWHIG